MKTKRQRFEKVAGNRVQTIIEKLELLGNCSNRNNYEYTSTDVKKMFTAIKETLSLTEQKFEGEVKKESKKQFKF